MNRLLLIIEDNPQNYYMMRFLLEKHGFSVVVAENGRDGIAAALRCRPAAVLLDIQLPEMDGDAVAAELRKNPDMKEVPVIAVTSYAMAGDRERYLGAGFDDYVTKPIVDEDVLIGAIERWLKPGD